MHSNPTIAPEWSDTGKSAGCLKVRISKDRFSSVTFQLAGNTCSPCSTLIDWDSMSALTSQSTASLQSQQCFGVNIVTVVRLIITSVSNGSRLPVVLAIGQGNPRAVRVLTSSSVPFGFRPGQKPDPLYLGRVVIRTEHKPNIIWPGWT